MSKTKKMLNIRYDSDDHVDAKTYGSVATLVILSLIYGLLLVAGIVIVIVPSVGTMNFGAETLAYGYAIGLSCILFVFPFGLYFATISPVMPDKRGRIIIFVVFAVLSLVMLAMYVFSIVHIKLDGKTILNYLSAWWYFILVNVIAIVGILTFYIVLMCKVNRRRKYDSRSTLGEIMRKRKYFNRLMVITTIMFTLLVYILICLAVYAIIGIIMFKIIDSPSYSASSPSSGTVYDTKTVSDEYGHDIEIKSAWYEKTYSDKYGNQYRTNDNGETFYKD